MLTFATFVILGVLLGMILRFSGFAFAICAVLSVYAWFAWQGDFLLLLRELALVTVALQVGYFLVILIALFLHHRPGRTP